MIIGLAGVGIALIMGGLAFFGALTYTVDTSTPTFSIFFHNGVMDRGEVELDQALPVTGPAGGTPPPRRRSTPPG